MTLFRVHFVLDYPELLIQFPEVIYTVAGDFGLWRGARGGEHSRSDPRIGPSNLLWDGPRGYRATIVGFPCDALDD